MKRRRVILAGGAVLAAVVCARASAGAGQAVFALHPEHYDPALAVTQSYFVTQEQPGSSFTNSVRVVNAGTRTGTVLLYAVDATTGRTSGAVYLDGTKPRRGVGSWVTLGTRSLTLGPGQSALVPVTVHVPATARPGDHLGGIVAENAAITRSSGKGALQIRVRHLTIVAVEVQVPGHAAALADVTGLRAGGEHGYQYVYLHLTNPGALTTKPTGRVTIAGADGKQVASQSFKLDTFLPGTAIDYPLLLPKQALAPGGYRATVKLTYGAAALGYRRTDGPTRTISRQFSFNVSHSQYDTVFRGVAPLKAPPAKADSGSSSGLPPFLIAGVLAALVAVLAFAAIGVRRWTRTAE